MSPYSSGIGSGIGCNLWSRYPRPFGPVGGSKLFKSIVVGQSVKGIWVQELTSPKEAPVQFAKLSVSANLAPFIANDTHLCFDNGSCCRLLQVEMGSCIEASRQLAPVDRAMDADARGTKTKVPLFGRTLSFQLPPGMVVANNKRNDTHVLIEYVPKGETLGNWTRLVTVQAFRGLGASPETTALIARWAFYPSACRMGPIYRDEGEDRMTSEVTRSIIANGCASLPMGAYPKAYKGAGEQDFIYVFRDRETIYTLNYAVCGASFNGKPPPTAVDSGKAMLQYAKLPKSRLKMNISENKALAFQFFERFTAGDIQGR